VRRAMVGWFPFHLAEEACQPTRLVSSLGDLGSRWVSALRVGPKRPLNACARPLLLKTGSPRFSLHR
jgi:hypothetical protein